MKTWNQLFVRHGWKLEIIGENTFNCKNETEANLAFLFESMDKAGVSYTMEDQTLEIHSHAVDEKEWIEAVSFEYRGRTENCGLSPDLQGPPIRELDMYISGIVRQLNRLGFSTTNSCDGHEKRSASVYVTKDASIEKLVEMLVALGMKRAYYRESQLHYRISFPMGRVELLDLAEKMSVVDESWFEHGHAYMKEQLFYSMLEELLSIPGESGNEQMVREFVKEKMTPFVDYLSVDRHGNLLAEKTYRGGNGPTILLNAHLDIAFELEANRTIIKENGIWTSSEGILGADDRAGVAVLIHTAETLLNSSFSGKVKYIFTVKEECGLVGARNVDNYFLWGTDAAIVVDRRGTGDIVTSCGGYLPFCDPAFGELIEKIAGDADVGEWACTSGGSSDTRIWAEHGIQSVNLSVGYGNEHTEMEFLNVAACYNVTKLIKAIFAEARGVKAVSQRVRMRNTIMADVKRA